MESFNVPLDLTEHRRDINILPIFPACVAFFKYMTIFVAFQQNRMKEKCTVKSSAVKTKGKITKLYEILAMGSKLICFAGFLYTSPFNFFIIKANYA